MTSSVAVLCAVWWWLACVTVCVTAVAPRAAPVPPANLSRSDTSYDWCDCGKGLSFVKVWATTASGVVPASVTVAANTSTYITFPAPIKSISWVCDGMSDVQTSSLSAPASVWAVKFVTKVKEGVFGLCSKPSGRLRWNTFAPVSFRTSVPYTSFAEGYACFKIPVLLRTAKNILLAFAEARNPDCSDFARTDLVVKRSTDGGLTWSPLRKVVEPDPSANGLCGGPLVVGNAAPVQLSWSSRLHPGRILVPHMRNNFHTWLVHSDDDGVSWSTPRLLPEATRVSPDGPDCNRNMTFFGVNSTHSFFQWIKELGWTSPATDPYRKWRSRLVGPWQFVGVGPPGALQLQHSRTHPGRVIVPGYHAFIRGLTAGQSGHGAGISLPVSQLYNNFALGHVLTSDDDGDTWVLRSENGFGGVPGEGGNEAQIAELPDGTLLINSRGFATASTQLRVQAVSLDGGDSFTKTSFVSGLPEPFDGCEGSLVSGGLNASTLFFSHPNPQPNHSIAPSILKLLGGNANLTSRDHMTIWESNDGGMSYRINQLVDAGSAGYSALQPSSSAALWLLYEQSDRIADSFSNLELHALIGSLAVLDPDRFVLRLLNT